jgi:hypothetical protein
MRRHVLCVLLAIAVVLGSLAIPTKVASRDEQARVELGWPFSLVVQDNSRYDPPAYPVAYDFENPQNSPTRILWGRFIVSVLLATAILEVALLLGDALRRRRA